MPWTKADIFNQALRHLGITEFVTDPEDVQDTHANILRGYYDVQVRVHLETHDWTFARSYYTLGVETGEESPFDEFPYIYQRPPQCLRFMAIKPLIPDVRIPWVPTLVVPETGSPHRRICTNIENAVGIYTVDVINEMPLWSWTFGAMIAARLALDYSGIRAPKRTKLIAEIYADARRSAQKHSAEEKGDPEHSDTYHVPDYISARG